MLILFDIDATMISTSGSGMKSMLDAGRRLFGPSFSIDGISFAGRLDPLIITEMFERNAVEPTPERRSEFRSVYKSLLTERLQHPETVAKSLPGVRQLLDALARFEHVRLGVLTGNFEETGSLKLRTCGIDPALFHLHVWGDESPSSPPKRDDLPGVAIKKYRERFKSDLSGDLVTVIGDTPHDVRCAQAHACRSLAVATGSFSLVDLHACAPTLAVQDLSDTDAVLAWLLGDPSSCR